MNDLEEEYCLALDELMCAYKQASEKSLDAEARFWISNAENYLIPHGFLICTVDLGLVGLLTREQLGIIIKETMFVAYSSYYWFLDKVVDIGDVLTQTRS